MPSSAIPSIGWRVWALGIVALGSVSLVLQDFDPGQSVPAWLPDRALWASVANAFIVIAGIAAQSCRMTARAAAALTAYYGVLVVVIMDGRVLLAHPDVFGNYSNIAEQLAIAAAGLIVYASHAAIDPGRAALLRRSGQIAFGICALSFGGAHFVYMNQTAPLVPPWLPPSQVFWAYATGAAHIAGGLAILAGVRARLAAILLTIMFAAFTPLVHLPMLTGDPHDHFIGTENALNIALTGAAWVVADSLDRPKAGPIPLRSMIFPKSRWPK